MSSSTRRTILVGILMYLSLIVTGSPGQACMHARRRTTSLRRTASRVPSAERDTELDVGVPVWALTRDCLLLCADEDVLHL
jgi:hypothetical protein